MPSSKDENSSRQNRVSTGRRWERHAANFYKDQGFTVLAQNYRAGSREIDLIVRRDNQIIFVEVKGSRDQQFGHPAEWVDQRKVVYLVEAAQRFMAENDVEGCSFRFDVVVFVEGHLEHYPDAFQAE